MKLKFHELEPGEEFYFQDDKCLKIQGEAYRIEDAYSSGPYNAVNHHGCLMEIDEFQEIEPVISVAI